MLEDVDGDLAAPLRPGPLILAQVGSLHPELEETFHVQLDKDVPCLGDLWDGNREVNLPIRGDVPGLILLGIVDAGAIGEKA